MQNLSNFWDYWRAFLHDCLSYLQGCIMCHFLLHTKEKWVLKLVTHIIWFPDELCIFHLHHCISTTWNWSTGCNTHYLTRHHSLSWLKNKKPETNLLLKKKFQTTSTLCKQSIWKTRILICSVTLDTPWVISTGTINSNSHLALFIWPHIWWLQFYLLVFLSHEQLSEDEIYWYSEEYLAQKNNWLRTLTVRWWPSGNFHEQKSSSSHYINIFAEYSGHQGWNCFALVGFLLCFVLPAHYVWKTNI